MFVNGDYIDDELIRLETATLKQQLREQMPSSDELAIAMRAREWARENVIERVLVEQAARADPAPIPPEASEQALQRYYSNSARHAGCMLPQDHEALRASIEIDLRVERLLEHITTKVPRPKPREISEYYKQAKPSLLAPESVHAAHIIKNVDETTTDSDALAAITEIRALLKNGASFEELADLYSDCPGRGGDLGVFPRGEMVEEFDAAVFHLDDGEISDVFRSPFGYHIAKLYTRKPAAVPSLNEVRAGIEQLLWKQRKEQAVASFVKNLRSKADVRKSSPASVSPAV